MQSSGVSPVPVTGPGWPRLMLASGALLGFLTVAMGALAAHLPDARLAPGGRALLRTAVEMQGWHVPALLACGLLLLRGNGRRTTLLLRASGLCFLAGIGCFCFGLYGLAFVGAGGAAAPFGGSVLMLGWLLLLAACAGAVAR